ncbi:hypothetical protein [Methylomicrobium lacus]
MKDAGFAAAVGNFLVRERQAVRAYRQNAADWLAFKK